MVVPGLSQCPYRLLSLQKQSRVYFNVTLPPKNVYYPNACHVGKHDSKYRFLYTKNRSQNKKKLAKQYKTIRQNNIIQIVQPQPMCAKFEYRNLSRYYSTNSATPPYISTNGTVNTRLLIDKPKNNQYPTKNL